MVPFGALVGARNNPYWSGSYDRQARRFHSDRCEPPSSTGACTSASPRTWWTIGGPAVAGDALELVLTVDLRRIRVHRFGAAVRVSGDVRGARVWCAPAGNRIGVYRLLGAEQVYANPAAKQSGDLQGAAEKLQAPQVATTAGTVHGEAGTATLHIFVDRSILEVYCGGAALADRLCPEPSATGVDLFAEDGVAHASTVSVWRLRGTW